MGMHANCLAQVPLPGSVAMAAITAPLDTIREVVFTSVCVLEEHGTDQDHFAFVLGLADETGGLWTRWPEAAVPTTVFLLPDCLERGPHNGLDYPCDLFAGHPGSCTWAREEPSEPRESS